jgi:Ca2+/H+ antiporter, TMEM165/GDT1 family
MLYLLLVTYGTVLLCEWVGDKNLYTITSFTMRFRPLYVFCGFTAAYMIKMGVAVMAGEVIAQLPTLLLTITSTLTFFIAALVIWFRRTDEQAATTRSENDSRFSKVSLLAFGTILFSEWGDVGQIMAATLTVRYHLPLIVWLGATLALITKGLLALVIGRGLRNRIPDSVLRPVCASLCVIMGIVSALQPLFSG